MSTVVLLGTLDTKGSEYAFLRDRLLAAGVDVILLDAGIHSPQGTVPDVPREEVAHAAGHTVQELADAGDRDAAVSKMAAGAGRILRGLYEQEQLDAVLAAGGGGGTSLAAHAMRQLPVGVPKIILSTLVAGDTRPIVGLSDLTLMHAVVDIAGLNRITIPMLANAAAAAAGMAQRGPLPTGGERPLIAATMFGLTTSCVQAARTILEDAGREVVVFHATGTGGRAMEQLFREGAFAGVLDITTTELADELVGGVLSAGPDRLESAGAAGVPQVVSLGALDMVNFGPFGSVPAKWRDRRLHRHNELVTLMRTTPDENDELGRRIAQKLNAATGPVVLFVPLRGTSAIAVKGQPFYDPAADEALVTSLRAHVGSNVELVELDLSINDPAFAQAMAERMLQLCAASP